MTDRVRAEVQSSGTNSFVGGDHRELYLLIEGEGWSSTRQCDPKYGEKCGVSPKR